MGAWLFRQMKIVKTCAPRALFHFDFTISCSLCFDARIRSSHSTLTFSVCRIFYFYGFATSPLRPFVLVPSQCLLAKWKILYFNHNSVISFSFLHKLKNWTEARRLKLISGVFFYDFPFTGKSMCECVHIWSSSRPPPPAKSTHSSSISIEFIIIHWNAYEKCHDEKKGKTKRTGNVNERQRSNSDSFPSNRSVTVLGASCLCSFFLLFRLLCTFTIGINWIRA